MVPVVGTDAVGIGALWDDDSTQQGGTDQGKQCWDDVIGKIISPELVRDASAEEIRGAEVMGAWVKVPREEAFAVTGKSPVGTRWVDTDKGDSKAPKVRSRVVAQDLRRESDVSLFVTPHIEFVKYLVSRVASNQDKGDDSSCLMIQDKEGVFHAPATRPIYVELPDEALAPGEKGRVCGKLQRSLYGTRDAALNWSLQYTRVLLSQGLEQCSSSPCTFHHPQYRICVTVHGDDFISEGTFEALSWMDKALREHFEVKTEILGAKRELAKEVGLLDRVITLTDRGLMWEPDQRHGEIALRDLGLDGEKVSIAVTPGLKEQSQKTEVPAKDEPYHCEECNCFHRYGDGSI